MALDLGHYGNRRVGGPGGCVQPDTHRSPLVGNDLDLSAGLHIHANSNARRHVYTCRHANSSADSGAYGHVHLIADAYHYAHPPFPGGTIPRINHAPCV